MACKSEALYGSLQSRPPGTANFSVVLYAKVSNLKLQAADILHTQLVCTTLDLHCQGYWSYKPSLRLSTVPVATVWLQSISNRMGLLGTVCASLHRYCALPRRIGPRWTSLPLYSTVEKNSHSLRFSRSLMLCIVVFLLAMFLLCFPSFPAVQVA